jgi:hypothetical protein
LNLNINFLFYCFNAKLRQVVVRGIRFFANGLDFYALSMAFGLARQTRLRKGNITLNISPGRTASVFERGLCRP